ncbi:MAG: sodium:proton antiporter [Acidobacteriota bacterium]|jgi:NhaP-type Na+/H+ or K+/H+ antiporter|nr:sodium:proton antiporter [Acidobacteriota bacterium]
MNFLAWMALVGGLLLLMALSASYLRQTPISTSFIYLIIGIAVSPLGFNVVAIDFEANKVFLEHLTEIAVIISLFVGGLKLRLPLKNKAWRAAFRLALPVMVFSIVCIAVFAHFAFGFDWAIAILLGALLAPTDPVLASSVSVENANDKDRMRYGLSGEAGFNDGMAFPFVVFALLMLENNGIGSWIGGWALHRLVWAVPVGLLIGYGLGFSVGKFAIWLRNHYKDSSAPNDFLALALIALSYVFAELVGAWGFLAVFAAGLGLRYAEIKTVEENPIGDKSEVFEDLKEIADEQNKEDKFADADESSHTPAENVVDVVREAKAMKEPAIAAGVVVSEAISFGITAERILEVFLVMIVGICIWNYWDWRAIPLALVFFFLIRPILTQIFLIGTPTGKWQRWMLGWFGIRGIGSIYYLAYALNHGLKSSKYDLTSLVISIIALSILIHGLSAQPILKKYENLIKARDKVKPDKNTNR